MNEVVAKFFEKLNSSADMQKKIAELDKAFAQAHAAPSPDAGTDAFNSFRKQALDEIVIPVAKDAGFEFTSDDLLAYAQNMSGTNDQELSTDELEAVAGGWGLYACAGLGLGVGETNHQQDCCIVFGYGVGACAVIGKDV